MFRGVVVTGLVAWTAIGQASAQTIPRTGGAQLPPSAQANRIEEQLQQPSGSLPATTAPVTIKREDTTAPEGADKTSMTLNQVVVDGVSVYGNDQIAPLYQKDIGKQVSLAEVYQIADDIMVKYRNDGYILAKAIIPPQRIENGVVHIKVIEGYIVKVDYDGDTRGNQAILDQYAVEIQGERPLKAETLERYLLLINDLPGVSAGSHRAARPQRPGRGQPDHHSRPEAVRGLCHAG